MGPMGARRWSAARCCLRRSYRHQALKQSGVAELAVAELRRIEALDEQPEIAAALFERDLRDAPATSHAPNVHARLRHSTRMSGGNVYQWRPEDDGEALFDHTFDITPTAVGANMHCEPVDTSVGCGSHEGQGPPPPSRHGPQAHSSGVYVRCASSPGLRKALQMASSDGQRGQAGRGV